MDRNRVVLPHPLGPSRASTVPGPTSSETSRSTGLAPKALPRPRTSMLALVAPISELIPRSSRLTAYAQLTEHRQPPGWPGIGGNAARVSMV